MSKQLFLTLCFLFVLLSVSADVFAQPTAFNFQGRLSDAEIQNLFVVDPTFGNGLAGIGGAFATNTVYTAVLQPDGKIIIAGTFTIVNGVAQNNVARLNANGTLDTTFASGLVLAGATFIINVRAVVLQTDGKIVIGGDFQSVNGSLRSGIARLNADGTLDTTFNPVSTTFLVPDVYAVAVQTDGKIVIGSNVSQVRLPIERLNANGTPDIPFVTNVAGLGVYAIALQTDGKIVIGGTFNFVNMVSRNSIARLNSDGMLDTAFGNGQAGINNSVRGVAVQTDGKVVVGGLFQTANGVARFGIARFNSDGTLDTSFGNGQTGTTGTVYAVKVQTDGKIVIGGGFININGVARNNIARLNADGTLDTSFGNGLAGADNNVFAIAIQPDKKIVIGGQFKFINGMARGGIARLTNASQAIADFDGDSKTDLSIFRPAPGEWWINRSSNGTTFATQFGSTSDKIAPVDFTGDGKTDVAFWRPSTGFWFVLRSEDSTFFAFPFGATGDVPAPADYDGDGKADAAVFRPSTLTWFISKSSGGTTITTFGATGDLPVVSDYDGDGKADIAIFRPAPGQWWIQRSSDLTVFALTFGTSTDKPVQGDYTGDGKADIAYWRPSTGFWFVLRSEDFTFFAFPFGASGDIPSPGDYDGDGKTDAAVFRPSNSTWFVQRSTAGTLIQQFGITGDQPVPNAFVP